MARCETPFFRKQSGRCQSDYSSVYYCIYYRSALVLPLTYEDTDWNMMSAAPTMEGYHFFGTDASGRDLLVRTAIGGRISLLVGIAGAFISVTIGTIYGAISGYVGGKTDMLMMRF